VAARGWLSDALVNQRSFWKCFLKRKALSFCAAHVAVLALAASMKSAFGVFWAMPVCVEERYRGLRLCIVAKGI